MAQLRVMATVVSDVLVHISLPFTSFDNLAAYVLTFISVWIATYTEPVLKKMMYVSTTDKEIGDNKMKFLRGAAVIVIILALMHLFVEVIQLKSLKLRYFLHFPNWIEISLFLFSILFVWVFHTDCLCPKKWQWEIGAIAVFLAWIELVLFVRRFPLTSTGIYIVMFFDIIATFRKLVVFALLLVLAFSFSLYMVFHEPEFSVSE